MPARWKGLSEYKRNFKWRRSDEPRLCIPKREQKCQWAGLRSDEFGISKEPSFISKRRVPHHNTQISKSFEWNGDSDSGKDASLECEVHKPVELCSNDNKGETNSVKIKTPDAPRLPEKVHSDSRSPRPESPVVLQEGNKSHPQSNEIRTQTPTKKDFGKIDNGLNRVLQKKAGISVSRSSSFPRSSEYQRQFVWKTPQKLPPLLAADQVIHSSSKSIPPYKCPVDIPETEYERSFKVSSPSKELQKKCILEKKDSPGLESVENSASEKNEREETGDQSMQSKTETKQKQDKQTQKPLCLHRSFRKMNTEYRSNFLSPAQYIYKDGAWRRIRGKIPDQSTQNTLNTIWYMEVKELREKAKAYRQRICGTHFSRDHLNQILSENNRLWDLSSDSSAEETVSNNVRALDLAGVPEKKLSLGPKALPQSGLLEEFSQNNTEKFGMSDAATVPVKQRLVWGEPSTEEQPANESPVLGEGKEKPSKQELGEIEKWEEIDKDVHTSNWQEENVNSPVNTSNSSPVSSGRGGRIPTPQLRTLGGAQRTHLDLTTPIIGGAVLVSPAKMKSSSSLQTSKEASEEHTLKDNLKRKSNRTLQDEKDAVLLSPSPAAGLKTLDPLPLRKDQWSNRSASDVQTRPPSQNSDQTPGIPKLKLTKDPSPSYWSPSCRIQGSLRHPEFQHNGNVAGSKKNWLQIPLQERNYHDEDDDDDRLSQLSVRSAASSSLASQVLERAQKRKENFWGKL